MRARSRVRVDPWWLVSLTVASISLLPVLALVMAAGHGSDGLWSHLLATVLPNAFRNTLLLLGGVAALATVLGTGSAWLVSAYDFPGRRILGWALLLPLAMPTYVIAYAYLDLLHPLGPIQGALRALMRYDSPRDLRLPDARHIVTCVLVLGFVLYPYVYLTTRALFVTQAANLLESGRLLGAGALARFWRIALPLARPAIAIGVVLVLLETLNDIGASTFLGVQTLTVTIFTTWVSRGDLAGAAQIAVTMLGMVMLLIWLERHSRRRQRYYGGRNPQPMRVTRLAGGKAALALSIGSLPVLLGFVVPATFLSWQALSRLGSTGVPTALFAAARNTIVLSATATLVTLILALAVMWTVRQREMVRRATIAKACSRIASLGYAVPGTVLAIGLLTPLAWFDQLANGLLQPFGTSSRMILMGSASAVMLAYVMRFMAISIGSIEAGMARIPPSLDQAAATLGVVGSRLLTRVHLPMIAPALGTAALLVFVDCMKELPATLVLRPMNFETLATWLYAEAVRGSYEDGAMAALLIVLSGLLPVLLMERAYFRRTEVP